MSGFVVWMTGLSGAGKSTLASLLTQELSLRGVHVECLDGDEVRKNLSHGLGFSREDRDRNVRRIGYVARMVGRSGACAITAAISPYKALRDEIRSRTENFLEVYCECPLDVLTERDPKGLYKRALAGEIKNFTGVDDPYEAPENPEVHLRTDQTTPAECVAQIIATLEKKGLIRGQVGSCDLPPPYGGEVFEARRATKAELEAPAISVGVDDALYENVLAVALGVFSPLSGFMTQREATKVEKSQALEGGTPWWSRPFVLPASDAFPSAGRANVGDTIALERGGERFALVRVEQVWEAGAKAMLAGSIDALSAATLVGPSARAVRQSARNAGAGHSVLLTSGGLPTDRARSLVEVANRLSNYVVLGVKREHERAWKALSGPTTGLLVLPQDFPFSDPRAALVVQKSMGARAHMDLDAA